MSRNIVVWLAKSATNPSQASQLHETIKCGINNRGLPRSFVVLETSIFGADDVELVVAVGAEDDVDGTETDDEARSFGGAAGSDVGVGDIPE